MLKRLMKSEKSELIPCNTPLFVLSESTRGDEVSRIPFGTTALKIFCRTEADLAALEPL